MSKSTTDKPFALKTSIICAVLIAIVYVLLATFSHQVGGNFHNTVYVTGVIILGILFFISSVWAYKAADGANDNISKAVVIGLTVAIIAWAGGWVVGSNEKVVPGSPQMEDAR
jgi:cation transport ATPase